MAQKKSLHFTYAFLQVIGLLLGQENLSPSPNIPEIVTAVVEAQRQVGFYNMIISFVVNKVEVALHHLGTEHPQTNSELILKILWDDICQLMWSAWNNIKHNQKNFATADEMITFADRLNWYHCHQDEVLDYHHRFLVDQFIKDVEYWKRATKQAKLLIMPANFMRPSLNRKAWNQLTNYIWMEQYKHLHTGQIIGDGLPNT